MEKPTLKFICTENFILPESSNLILFKGDIVRLVSLNDSDVDLVTIESVLVPDMEFTLNNIDFIKYFKPIKR